MGAAGVGYLAAFAAGLVSFASPCVLPLVPAYLSVITGLEIGEFEQGLGITCGVLPVILACSSSASRWCSSCSA